MTFVEKTKSIFNKGVSASKDLAHKAGEKAEELGSMGALKIENAQLKSQADKLIAKLGNEVYANLVDMNHATVSRDTLSIKGILDEIKGLRSRIELKEKEYRSIGGKAKAQA